MKNNLLDSDNKYNFLFLASSIAVLCESSPITLNLDDIEKFWSGKISLLEYNMNSDSSGHGSITFSLREDKNDN